MQKKKRERERERERKKKSRTEGRSAEEYEEEKTFQKMFKGAGAGVDGGGDGGWKCMQVSRQDDCELNKRNRTVHDRVGFIEVFCWRQYSLLATVINVIKPLLATRPDASNSHVDAGLAEFHTYLNILNINGSWVVI